MWWGYKIVPHFGKYFLQFLLKLIIYLCCGPEILLVGICPKEMKMYAHKKTCIRMFTATLFILASNWKEVSVSRKINCGIIHKKDYYSGRKNYEILICETTRANHENIERKKPDTKEYILNNCIYINFQNRQNLCW